MSTGLSKPAPRSGDPSHDFLRSERGALDAIFHPQSVAVVGATDREGSVGRTVLANLRAEFKGRIFAVNPKRTEVLGAPSFPAISAIPEKLDLAVIVTPAATVPGVVRECVQAGVGGAVIISAGFRERGAEGKLLERAIQDELRGSSMRVIGPNCLGVMNPLAGLNATFAAKMARKGNIAFLSQSGALCTAILDWSMAEMVGFSAFVSTGSMLDVNWGDLIYYFGDDPNTQAILLYMESVGDARTFLSAAREIALTKPIIVIKAGRTQAASKAAVSHTGALTGSDDVLDAAFKRCGVLRVQSIADLFHMAEVLSKQPRPRGPRLTIVTNAGGPGVLATDALIGNQGELATLSGETLARLDAVLPAHWSHGNPVDVLGDADPARYSAALTAAIADPATDGLLAVMAPQGMSDPAHTAAALAPFAHGTGKPVLASWMGGEDVAGGVAVMNQAGIPTFSYPDTAARIFASMWRYSDNLRALYETPTISSEIGSAARGKVEGIIARARSEKRALLDEAESKQVLAAYWVPVVATEVARTLPDALAAAERCGFPVVLKLFSHTITHKSDIGGVRLDLKDERDVRDAYAAIEKAVDSKLGAGKFEGVTVQPMVRTRGHELILGSSQDPQFGPVLMFGSGGVLVEVYQDRALALPPLNTTLARRLMEQTKIYTALRGARGRAAVDMAALELLLVRFSQLVAEQHWIKEIDINPLLASGDTLMALDARVVLHSAETKLEDVPRLAIRPYPAQYAAEFAMRDGQKVTIRPIRPEDEPAMVRFHQTLSERSVYLRYFHVTSLSNRTEHDRLTRICFIDYDREIALLALRTGAATHEQEVVAVGRLSKLHGSNEAEFAILVSDLYQRRGLGTELLRRLIEIGRAERLDRITAAILPENREMQIVAGRLGYELKLSGSGDIVHAAIDLR
ncbi:MAG: bifunctional acetate--CoA ligase family protein/GNAT family N-acetyltransferase [Candidatus Koribacter versatilis]|uniref:Bifunctional acetate--CoA ligase family protein/GNAT family N-acetyltransferase n=1 Tax=Candidatus Korobacter versatilis TaxID=658062 RepID=A0A932ENJ0_9BACT|nr:bifunctional acetate--CoA ligase family protein/GNAT family N-acetyltransferase [Candidatus Koribacter versatilis]